MHGSPGGFAQRSRGTEMPAFRDDRFRKAWRAKKNEEVSPVAPRWLNLGCKASHETHRCPSWNFTFKAHFCWSDVLAVAVESALDHDSTGQAFGGDARTYAASTRVTSRNRRTGVGAKRGSVHLRICPSLLVSAGEKTPASGFGLVMPSDST